MSQPQVWLVTGASSGFGRYVTEIALSKGDTVVATARTPQSLDDLKAKYPADKLHILKLDVTKPEEITAVFEKVKETIGRIDVVFNNAGFILYGEIEAVPHASARAQFETNFWGAVEVTIQAIKFFREVNKPMGGRLLNMSSILGVLSVPSSGWYCASKHALEAVSETLVGELDPEWNIKLTIIEPGMFATDVFTKSQRVDPPPAYNKPTLGGVQWRKFFLESDPAKLGNARKASEKVYEIARVADPPLRLPLGKEPFERIPIAFKQIQDEMAKYESWQKDLYNA
ncbi:NAD(P)-binding protein [Panus rudis PR-1116 ss-1]|nr:NAD(P)-binding protein [Panus rudis PR-1116 ss-1]